MKYRHYKGGIYGIICEARLEADPDVVMMVYQSAADGMIWTRPKEAFLELVEWEGCMVPRFAAIASS
jgi:hypothetical protein